MPAQSTLNADEKAKVKSVIPPTSGKIEYATLARIYYAHPEPTKWSYTGLQGALVFVRALPGNTPSFKMVDIEGTRGIIWEHELYEGFQYHPDRSFFHSFPGDVSFITTTIVFMTDKTFFFVGLHDWLRFC